MPSADQKQILHIASNHRLIDTAYEIFENAAPGQSRYIAIGHTGPLNHVQQAPIEIISRKEAFSTKFLRSLTSYSFVVFHAFFDFNKFLIAARAPREVTLVWIGWGCDYFPLTGTSPRRALGPLTKNITPLLIRSSKKTLKLDTIFWWIMNTRFPGRFLQGMIYGRLDFFAPVLEEEYRRIRQRHPNFKPRFIDWNYNAVYRLICEHPDLRVNGNGILVGNSATPTCNHLEAFEALERNGIGDRRVITPLSYGDLAYAKRVKEEGTKSFQARFQALEEMLPLDDYLETVKSCSVALMLHYRQQGLANTHLLLALGCKIFFSPKSPVYTMLSSRGAVVFTIDQLPEQLEIPLSPEHIERNRQIVQQNIGDETILNKTTHLIQTASQRRHQGCQCE